MQQNATEGRGSALNNVGVTARLPQILSLVLRGSFVALRGGDREEGERDRKGGEIREC